MTTNIKIRPEETEDYFEVERITREAFWNLHAPGCDEHYLVHVMRSHKDFIQELDYVAILENKIIGNIMYMKSFLEHENGNIIPIVSFGPVCVLPVYQRKGIGSQLIQKTIIKVKSLGYPAIVIWGNPGNYVKYGFKNCKDFNISVSKEKYPTGLLALVFNKEALGNGFLWYKESDVYNLDNKKADEFDRLFETKEKRHQYSQELFNILSRSEIR